MTCHAVTELGLCKLRKGCKLYDAYLAAFVERKEPESQVKIDQTKKKNCFKKIT